MLKLITQLTSAIRIGMFRTLAKLEGYTNQSVWSAFKQTETPLATTTLVASTSQQPDDINYVAKGLTPSSDIDIQSSINKYAGSLRQLNQMNEVCLSASTISDVIKLNESGSIQCGWYYNKGTGSIPQLNKGYLSTKQGPVVGLSPPPPQPPYTSYFGNNSGTNRFFTASNNRSLQAGEQQIETDRCNLPTCEAVTGKTGCAYCKTSLRGIPVDQNGKPKYASLTCAGVGSLATSASMCPPPATVGPAATGETNSETANSTANTETSLIRPVNIPPVSACSPDTNSRFSGACLQSVLRDNGCGTQGSLSLALNGFTTTTNVNSVQNNNPNIKTFMEGNPAFNLTNFLTASNQEDAKTQAKALANASQTALNDAWKNPSRQTKQNTLAVDLCTQRGYFLDNYNFCVELSPTTPIPAKGWDLTCLQQAWKEAGLRPQGTAYPTIYNIKNYNKLSPWSKVTEYMARIYNQIFNGGDIIESFESNETPYISPPFQLQSKNYPDYYLTYRGPTEQLKILKRDDSNVRNQQFVWTPGSIRGTIRIFPVSDTGIILRHKNFNLIANPKNTTDVNFEADSTFFVRSGRADSQMISLEATNLVKVPSADVVAANAKITNLLNSPILNNFLADEDYVLNTWKNQKSTRVYQLDVIEGRLTKAVYDAFSNDAEATAEIYKVMRPVNDQLYGVTFSVNYEKPEAEIQAKKALINLAPLKAKIAALAAKAADKITNATSDSPGINSTVTLSGYFLRHAGGAIYLNKTDGSQLFHLDSTFQPLDASSKPLQKSFFVKPNTRVGNVTISPTYPGQRQAAEIGWGIRLDAPRIPPTDNGMEIYECRYRARGVYVITKYSVATSYPSVTTGRIHALFTLTNYSVDTITTVTPTLKVGAEDVAAIAVNSYLTGWGWQSGQPIDAPPNTFESISHIKAYKLNTKNGRYPGRAQGYNQPFGAFELRGNDMPNIVKTQWWNWGGGRTQFDYTLNPSATPRIVRDPYAPFLRFEPVTNWFGEVRFGDMANNPYNMNMEVWPLTYNTTGTDKLANPGSNGYVTLSDHIVINYVDAPVWNIATLIFSVDFQTINGPQWIMYVGNAYQPDQGRFWEVGETNGFGLMALPNSSSTSSYNLVVQSFTTNMNIKETSIPITLSKTTWYMAVIDKANGQVEIFALTKTGATYTPQSKGVIVMPDYTLKPFTDNNTLPRIRLTGNPLRLNVAFLHLFDNTISSVDPDVELKGYATGGYETGVF
jgi:hypothetical protein